MIKKPLCHSTFGEEKLGASCLSGCTASRPYLHQRISYPGSQPAYASGGDGPRHGWVALRSGSLIGLQQLMIPANAAEKYGEIQKLDLVAV